MAISSQFINSVHFVHLKGLNDVVVSFSGSRVTGLFGVNGCGKSTILHALACIYQPAPDSDNAGYKFPEFFTPSTLGTWQGSRFKVNVSFKDSGVLKNNTSYTFKKEHDRWEIRNTLRPIREVFFIGVRSCIPAIEIESQKSRIQFIKEQIEDNKKAAIINDISHILNEPITDYASYCKVNKKYLGIKAKGLEYPAHFMGAGSQRLFVILDIIHHAPKYSLILIDELDITLHTDALNRLVDKLVELADRKSLQIIFTSHREKLCERDDINVRHIIQTAGKTLCFNQTTPNCISNLTGETPKLMNIYVEDDISKAIVKRILRLNNIRGKAEITSFGSIENSFVLASALVLMGKERHSAILTDGDRYITQEEKTEQIKKFLTGTENNIDEQRYKALCLIKQYNMPESACSPDKFLWKCLQSLSIDNEIVNVAKRLNHRDDSHKYIKDIMERCDASVDEIVELASKSELWGDVVRPLNEWLDVEIDELGLMV